mmetsp:Transcript_22366/g.36999  ORF Transcript_22366/g.36999 Transcript_22366/m.36999 type:complete len:253 (-) Transcript_22366:26-784(-)
MTSTISTSTNSTNKAYFVLARRRERRRNLESNQTSPLSSEKGVEATNHTSTESLKGEEAAATTGRPTVTPTIGNSERRQDQEKANNYLSQRRARRRRAKELQPSTLVEKIETTPPPKPASVEKSPTVIPVMREPQRLIVLISDGVSDRKQASNQSRALQLLKTKNVIYVSVDGMDPNQRARRNELFGVSGIRANYPQFFLEQKDGTTAFVGDWEVIEGINDSSALPAETIEAFPDLMTWDRVFGNLVDSFDE